MYIQNVSIFQSGATYINNYQRNFKELEVALNSYPAEYRVYKDGNYEQTLSGPGLALVLEHRERTGADSDIDGWAAVHINWSADRTEMQYIETWRTIWGNPPK